MYPQLATDVVALSIIAEEHMLISTRQIQGIALLADQFHRNGKIVEKRQAIILGQHFLIATQVADGHAHAQTLETRVKDRANVKSRGAHIDDMKL